MGIKKKVKSLIPVPKPRYHQNITVTIKTLGANGEGVGHWHGYTIFAQKTLPGEEVRGRLIEKQKRYGRLQVSQIVAPSSLRIVPPCPYFERCGGCQLMHLDYSHQLEFKRHRVAEDLKRFGNIEDIDIAPCSPSPRQLSYRNKMQVPVAQGNEGKLALGLYASNSHDLVDIEGCLVHCEEGEQIFHTCRSLLQISGVMAYDPQTSSGELRYLLIKTAVNTRQVLIIFVTACETTPALKNLAQMIKAQCPSVQGILYSLNATPDNVVLGQSFHLLEGNASIEERLLGLTFKISPASFFQINPFQAEQVYLKALEGAALTGQETVLDAYCGVGTLALLMAKQAKQVIGVECVPQAIEDACHNAQLNGCHNVQFVCDNAEDYIATLHDIDVVLLNPPRKGCEPSFLQALGKLQPRKIIYVSCDPATLGRDLALLLNEGYRIEKVHPFDMFPQTSHVECVAILNKS